MTKTTAKKKMTSQASGSKGGRSVRMRNVVFLSNPHGVTTQSFQWRVPARDMIFSARNTGREHQMVDFLMQQEFSKCVEHYQKTGKVNPRTVFEFSDMYVAAAELGGTRPQIHQVHVYDPRAGMVRE